MVFSSLISYRDRVTLFPELCNQSRMPRRPAHVVADPELKEKRLHFEGENPPWRCSELAGAKSHPVPTWSSFCSVEEAGWRHQCCGMPRCPECCGEQHTASAFLERNGASFPSYKQSALFRKICRPVLRAREPHCWL